MDCSTGGVVTLAGRAALVTGAASGIGLATARILLEGGATVWLADLDFSAASAAATAWGPAAQPMALDVTSEMAWTKALDHVMEAGGLDILVNAAGIASVSGPEDLEYAALEGWRKVFAVNVEGTMLGCRAAIHAMRVSGGAIVNVASTTAVHATPTLAAYGASKAAVLQYTRSVAVYCAQQGYPIRCNAVLPGMVDTPMTGALPPTRRGQWEAQIPNHRFGQPEEVARAIAFLAGPDSSYITGEGLAVDGGFLSRSGIDAYAG